MIEICEQRISRQQMNLEYLLSLITNSFEIEKFVSIKHFCENKLSSLVVLQVLKLRLISIV